MLVGYMRVSSDGATARRRRCSAMRSSRPASMTATFTRTRQAALVLIGRASPEPSNSLGRAIVSSFGSWTDSAFHCRTCSASLPVCGSATSPSAA